ncbi:hypothetical protein [Alcanivorax sp.]|uniref:HNH endonuclease n=1 Tax=Alcanivorax sp. TaxID=1872427 RepID=UPI0025BF5D06|nr:hypothetical protein [Alcanivorax sp.]
MDKRLHKIDYTGWGSNIFGASSYPKFGVRPSEPASFWIHIVDRSFVSKPCWEALVESSTQHTLIETIFCRDTHFDDETCEVTELLEHVECHRFVFEDPQQAKKLAMRVMKSAKDKRREKERKAREAQAEGFHTNACIDRIFEIQQGRCYYSGEPLIRDPINFSRDHIMPIRFGGTDWPGNIVLALKGINSWKGATKTKEMTLNWLAGERGTNWMFDQIDFCDEVDRLRAEYDQQFRRQLEE